MFHHGTQSEESSTLSFLFSEFLFFLRVGITMQSEAFHLSIQPRPVVVKDLCGPFNVSARSFECLRDRFPLDFLDSEIRRDDAAEISGLRSVKLFRQTLRRQFIFGRKEHS